MLRVSHSGAAACGREGASYDFLLPPIKTDTPNGKPQSPPKKSKAHFQEMILEKKPFDKSETVINTCDCFTHKKTLEKDDRYSTKNVNFFMT